MKFVILSAAKNQVAGSCFCALQSYVVSLTDPSLEAQDNGMSQ